MAEFRRDVLDQLRQPLEEGEVWISRARQRSRFPARVALVAATNPCPCGQFGDPERACTCGEHQRQRYWSRLSGPLLDRIDLQVIVRRLEADELTADFHGESSGERSAANRPEGSGRVAQRVQAARSRMARRNPGGWTNSRLGGADLRRHGHVAPRALELWERAIRQRRLSARSAERVLRVSRTIADLNDEQDVGAHAIAEALTYRSFDRG